MVKIKFFKFTFFEKKFNNTEGELKFRALSNGSYENTGNNSVAELIPMFKNTPSSSETSFLMKPTLIPDYY